MGPLREEGSRSRSCIRSSRHDLAVTITSSRRHEDAVEDEHRGVRRLDVAAHDLGVVHLDGVAIGRDLDGAAVDGQRSQVQPNIMVGLQQSTRTDGQGCARQRQGRFTADAARNIDQRGRKRERAIGRSNAEQRSEYDQYNEKQHGESPPGSIQALLSLGRA